MLNWNFAKKLFDGFTILRWTDFIRPAEYVQIEKSASQSILTYIIGKEYEERTGKKINWRILVDKNIYGLLCKIATSDIKSTISNKIKKDHLNELKNFIINIYFDKSGNCKYTPDGLINKDKLNDYIMECNSEENRNPENRIEYEIFFLAHKYATYREFLQIIDFNRMSPDCNQVEMSLNPVNLKDMIMDETLKGILFELSNKDTALSKFFAYFEKLKPQIRWAQTYRIPQTTVLGHSMYVAMLTYFSIEELSIKENTDNYIVDSFYSALFHDLPESLTRDIISPVKRNIENLEKELSFYEFAEVNEKIIPLIKDKKWKDDFLYLLGSVLNNNEFSPFEDRIFVLGHLIEFIDKIAAFMEAKMSVELGVNSDEIQKGIKNVTLKLKDQQLRFNATDKILYCNDFLASIPLYQEGV